MATILISAGDVAAMDLDTAFRIFPRGRVVWESAQFTSSGNVRLARLQVLPEGVLRQVNRYISDSTCLEVEVNESSRIAIEQWKDRAEEVEW